MTSVRRLAVELLLNQCYCSRYVSSGSSTGAHILGSKKLRLSRKKTLNNNRRNPELEIAARNGKLIIPLSIVHNEWQSECGPSHLQRAGEHYNLFSDVYNRVFQPLGFMDVKYGDIKIRRGNIVYPKQVQEKPHVTLPDVEHLYMREGSPFYWTLAMTNPDGHLLDNKCEVLHWMIGNITVKNSTLSTGELLCPYLPPVPPQGTGVHRIVFSLYGHKEPIVYTPLNKSSSWLKERTFNTSQFLSSYPHLSPFTFSFFQTLWDESVGTMYSNKLGGSEPIYEVKKPLTVHENITRTVKEVRKQKFRNLLTISQ